MKWLILLWPFMAATSSNRDRYVERIAIWHALIASYVAWGVVTGMWLPPLLHTPVMPNAPGWLPWAGWGAWLAIAVTWPFTRDHGQISYALAFFGTWMIGYGGHPSWLPMAIFVLAVIGSFAESSGGSSPELMRLADSMLKQPRDEDRNRGHDQPTITPQRWQDGLQVAAPRTDDLDGPPGAQAPATETATEPVYPVDDGSARAAGARERAALRRAKWFEQFDGGKQNPALRWSLQDQARTARDDAEQWQVAGLARLRREVKMAQRSTTAEPVRPLTKNCLPALLPMTYPADFRTLERWAARVGATVRLGSGRTLNALGERWSMERIDAELPALSLPQLIGVWLRTRALLGPDRLPGDDDWNWTSGAPGNAPAYPTAEFTIAMDGEVATPARLVDVSDLRWLEELYAVEGSWTARQRAGDATAVAGFDGWQTVRVAPADQRLIERHAFAIGARVSLEDGREVNTDGERWSRQRIDAELPLLPNGGPM